MAKAKTTKAKKTSAPQAATLSSEMIGLLHTIRRDTEAVRQIVATARLALEAVNTGETIDISNVLRIHADDSLCTLGEELTALIARIEATDAVVVSTGVQD